MGNATVRSAVLGWMLMVCLLLSSCASGGGSERYSREFYDSFGTDSRITAYTDSEEDFDTLYTLVTDELLRLHRLFDIYHSYDGLHNLHTINEQAGLAPVMVDGDIMAMLTLCREAHRAADGAVNAALGSVLTLWHAAGETKQPPSMDALKAAAAKTDMAKLILDEEAGTVFLAETGMSLDVGAIAKGYAAQKAVDIARDAGYDNLLLDLGGNIIALGTPPEKGKDFWRVGIEDPFSEEPLDILAAENLSVVTSGTYQRYFMADGVRYHHIIHPATLFPADLYEAVTILHEDGGIADFLSTALFLLPTDKGRELLEQYGGAAIWLYPDGSREASDGYEDFVVS